MPSFLQAGSWARATRTATDKPKPPRTNRERGHTGTKGAEAELEQSPSGPLFPFFFFFEGPRLSVEESRARGFRKGFFFLVFFFFFWRKAKEEEEEGGVTVLEPQGAVRTRTGTTPPGTG